MNVSYSDVPCPTCQAQITKSCRSVINAITYGFSYTHSARRKNWWHTIGNHRRW